MSPNEGLTVDLEEFAGLSRYTGFLYFSTMTTALGADTRRYQAECIKLKGEESNQEPLTQQEYAELGFWYRGYARALLIFVEGLLFVMRRLVCHAEERGEVELSRGESHLIRETEYLLKNNTIQERPKFSRITDSFRLTFRLFPQVFGSPFTINYVDDGWAKFQKLVKLRNDLTHSKAVRDTLLDADLINIIRDAGVWVFSCMQGITSSMDRALMEQSFRETMAMPEVQKIRDHMAQSK